MNNSIIILAVPDAPDLNVIPYYEEGVLIGVDISFSKVHNYNSHIIVCTLIA